MRRILWLIPFMWPVALAKSIKAGQAKQADLILAAHGIHPEPHHTPLGRLARYAWRRARS